MVNAAEGLIAPLFGVGSVSFARCFSASCPEQKKSDVKQGLERWAGETDVRIEVLTVKELEELYSSETGYLEIKKRMLGVGSSPAAGASKAVSN